MAIPSCRYINVSRSTSDNRSNVDDVEMAAVHIQLRTDEAAADVAASASDESCQPTEASTDTQTALPTAPVCGGYIVAGPDTFGHYDLATGRFVSTDSGIVADHSLQRLHSNDRNNTASAGQNDQHSDLTVPVDVHRLLAAGITASDGDGLGNVDIMQGNSNASDSTPVANYTVIMGMDGNQPVDTNSVALHRDTDLTTGEELLPTRSISDRNEQEDDLAVPYGISSPPVCYSLNSGGYLSHSELLGAAPALWWFSASVVVTASSALTSVDRWYQTGHLLSV